MKNLSANGLLFIAFALLMASCNKMELNPLIDPETQPSELSRALIMEGANYDGTMPASATGSVGPQITHFQNSAVTANDNTLFIPLAFEAGANIEKIYLQVSNADNYWQLPVLIDAAQQSHVFKMGIPDRVLNGEFEVGVAIEDAQGSVSQPAYLSVSVEPSEKVCQDGQVPDRIEGTDGLTVKTLYFGDQPGIITISYEMYSKPDRMDIFYNREWVAGTGSKITANTTPPSSQCYDGTEGYVPGQGSVSFQYDPTKGKRVDVYLSGCFGGTEWYFDVECPRDWFGELPDCPCEYQATIDNTTAMGGTWHDNGTGCTFAPLSTYHYGASYELRWKRNSGPETSGQQCTYDANKKLITAGIAAGSPDRYGVDGCFDYNGDHIRYDVDTWKTYSCKDYLRLWPANSGNNCPKNEISGIGHMEKLVGDMTCEEVTVLLKAAADSDEISNYLRSYLQGEQLGFIDESVIRHDLQEWKNEDCDGFWDPDHCALLDEAIENMGG